MTQTLPQMYGYSGQQQGPPGHQQTQQGQPQPQQHSSYQPVPPQHGPPQYRVSPDGQAVTSPYGPPPSHSSASDPRYTPPQYRGPEGQHMNSSYGPPPPGPAGSGTHPNGINPNRPEMAPVHPQYHQQHYQSHDVRLPGPTQFYSGQQDYRGQQEYRPPPQSGQQQSSGPTHAAPRQRTAIACKYCRRRKIRCSGFENSEDGRCQNCQRFNQECVFTPVSAQTQAFVPASALYAQQRGRGVAPPQYYGPQGQPLPRQPEPYPPLPGQPYNLPSPGYPPPPQGHNQSPYGPPGYPQPPYEQPPSAAGRRRTRDEPHNPTLPPPNPATSSHLAGHPGSEHSPYAYSDPSYANGTGGSSSAGPYPSHPSQAYYSNQPYSHTPPAGYQYEQPRDTSSPHSQQGYSYGQSGSASQATPTSGPTSGRTPPPLSNTSDNGANRNSVAIRDIVSENNGANGQGERTAADSDMVSALNRTSRR